MDPMPLDDILLDLERLPSGGDQTLRAWNTADLYLVRHVLDTGLLEQSSRIAIVNDTFGALTIGIRSQNSDVPLQVWNDSALAQRTVAHNLALNGLGENVEAWPTSPIEGSADAPEPARDIDIVLIRFPKSLAWLEEQLLRLRPRLAPGATVIAGGMIKHTPRRAFELLENCIGPTTTSLGWKKARLAFATFAPELDVASYGPTATFQAEGISSLDGITLTGLPGVFSWSSLDLGARMILEHLEVPDDTRVAVDQGCGNGVLAIAMARAAAPAEAKIWATDDSQQAIRCARMNAEAAGVTDRIRFLVDDDLGVLEEDFGVEADFIVCNPPFHQDHVVGDHIAWNMFMQAKRALTPGGSYLVVGNRHMEYADKLQRLFGRCIQVGADKRFVVLKASKR